MPGKRRQQPGKGRLGRRCAQLVGLPCGCARLRREDGGIEEKQEEPPVEKQSAATTKNRNSGTKKEEEKKNRKGWGIGDLFKNAVDKVGEGIDKALKDEQ